ncbi:MAG TPA: hypothetical protein VGC76_05675, partial [Pyrinomonadaceae bacterium]
RVALFADTFHEVNGAANVLRRLTDFAKTNGYPFLCIRTGKKTRVWEVGRLRSEKNVRFLEIKKFASVKTTCLSQLNKIADKYFSLFIFYSSLI